MITTPPNKNIQPLPLKPIANAKSNRGAFILLEGVDRCGKTTQCALLLKHLLSLSLAAAAFRFPDRTTNIGQVIHNYLTTPIENKAILNDQAIHLLFSANRWEVAPRLSQTLANGTHVVCDRYAYSGVAFTSAKENKNLNLNWCMAPDRGLPAPDVVIFLHLDQEETEKRGGYGGERYEKRDLQNRVRQRFFELKRLDCGNDATDVNTNSADQQSMIQGNQGRIPWHIVDASQSIEDIHKEIKLISDQIIASVSNGKPMMKMWEDGYYDLPDAEIETKADTNQEEK